MRKHTVRKNEKFNLTEKKFRQIKLVISLVKPLLSRNFCQKCVRVNFRNFYILEKSRFFPRQINVFLPIFCFVNKLLLEKVILPIYSKYVAVMTIETHLVNFNSMKSFAAQNRTFGV